MTLQKPVAKNPNELPPHPSSAAFVSYVYSHNRKSPLPETPRPPVTPRKGKASSAA